MSNKEVAIYLMQDGLPYIDGVVFIGAGDAQMIYERKSQRSIKLADSSIEVERRFHSGAVS